MENHLSLAQRTLAENLERQKQIDEELNELRRGKSLGAATGGASSQDDHGEDHVQGTKKPLTVFQVPYFKDGRGFTHPPNRDTLAKQQNDELDPYMSNPREWSYAEKKKLTMAVGVYKYGFNVS